MLGARGRADLSGWVGPRARARPIIAPCAVSARSSTRAGTRPRRGPALVAALRHRGPDGDGVRRDRPRAAGPHPAGDHRRRRRRPAAGLRGRHASRSVVNGEIYNHRELRAELEARGHRFATALGLRGRSSTSTRRSGPDCVRRLNGMFAFALWDDRRQRLVAARDPFGVKPLYWAQAGGRLALASEVGALLAAGAGLAGARPRRARPLPRLALRPRPAHPVRRRLQARRRVDVLVAEPGRPPSVTSYREAPGAPLGDASPRELEAELAERFVAAVERQMMSDVPYGAFLSGGIDSAAIAAAMARVDGTPPQHLHDRLPRPRRRRSTSARRRPRPARRIGTDHRAVAMSRDRLPRASSRDLRRAARGAVRHPLRARAAPAQRVHRALGQGRALGPGRRRAARRLPAPPGRRGAAAASALLPAAVAARRCARPPTRCRATSAPSAPRGCSAPATPADRLLRIFEIAPAGAARRSCRRTAASEAAAERRALAEGVLADVADRDPLEQALYLDTHLFLPDGLLIYGDKMSMAHGLEQRVPFLDVELMRFVERIPAQRAGARACKRKWLHRRAMRAARAAGGRSTARSSRSRRRTTAGCASRWATRSSARFAPGTELSAHVDPRRVAQLVARAPQRARGPQAPALLPARARRVASICSPAGSPTPIAA